jgi:hypothetical protein
MGESGRLGSKIPDRITMEYGGVCLDSEQDSDRLVEQGEPGEVGPCTSDRSVQARGANGPTKAILAQPQKEGGQGQDGLDCIRPSNMFLVFYFLFLVLFQISNSKIEFDSKFKGFQD